MAQLLDTTLINDASLVHYYKGDDVNDSKGSNNLTNTNAVAFNAALYGNGFDFSSTNTNKRLSHATSNGYAGAAFAISYWVKLLAEIGSGGYSFVQIADAGSDTRLDLFYEFNGGTRQLRGGRTRTGTANDFSAHTVTLGTTNFHHIVHTYDGSTVKIYLDNVEIISVASSGAGSGETAGFSIGSTTVLDQYASAIVDDVSLFDRNLTPADVAILYLGNPLEGDSAYFI